MTKQELIEALAEQEHTGWTCWQSYFFSKCTRLENGDLLVPAGYVHALQRQIDTPYAALSEREKQADRDEVAHILPCIDQYAEAQSGIEYVGKAQPPQMILPDWMHDD